MTVPKTAVYKHDRTISRKHQIGLARDVFYVQAISHALRMQKPAYLHLRGSVLSPDT